MGGMTSKQIAARIKVLEAKAAKLRAAMAKPGADLCALQGKLDAVSWEHAELEAQSAEVGQ